MKTPPCLRRPFADAAGRAARESRNLHHSAKVFRQLFGNCIANVDIAATDESPLADGSFVAHSSHLVTDPWKGRLRQAAAMVTVTVCFLPHAWQTHSCLQGARPVIKEWAAISTLLFR